MSDSVNHLTLVSSVLPSDRLYLCRGALDRAVLIADLFPVNDNLDHTHDSRYYTEAEVLALIAVETAARAPLPLGKIASTAIPLLSTGSATPVTICTVTWTAVAGRLYKVSANGRFNLSNAVGDRGTVTITNNADAVLGELLLAYESAVVSQGFAAEGWVFVTGSGSTTCKLRESYGVGGTGAMASQAVGTFMVEDIGLA